MADILYAQWKSPLMRNTVNEITSALEEGNVSLEFMRTIYTELKHKREDVIEAFVVYKRSNGRDEKNFNFSASQVTGMPWTLREPEEKDDKGWLHFAKGVALRIEQFHSHTMHKNRNPGWKPGRRVYEGDTRVPRTIEEQEWLVAEDRYTKITNRLRRKGKGKKRARRPAAPREPEPAMPPGEAPYQGSRGKAPIRVYPPASSYQHRTREPVRARGDRPLPKFPSY